MVSEMFMVVVKITIININIKEIIFIKVNLLNLIFFKFTKKIINTNNGIIEIPNSIS